MTAPIEELNRVLDYGPRSGLARDDESNKHILAKAKEIAEGINCDLSKPVVASVSGQPQEHGPRSGLARDDESGTVFAQPNDSKESAALGSLPIVATFVDGKVTGWRYLTDEPQQVEVVTSPLVDSPPVSGCRECAQPNGCICNFEVVTTDLPPRMAEVLLGGAPDPYNGHDQAQETRAAGLEAFTTFDKPNPKPVQEDKPVVHPWEGETETPGWEGR